MPLVISRGRNVETSLLRHPSTAFSLPRFPLVGHLPWFLADRLGFLEKWARQGGEVASLDIGRGTYLLTNPEDIKHVLVANPDNYEKSARMTSRRGREIAGEGLLTASAEAHLKERRMLQPVFYRTVLARFSAVMTARAEAQFDTWKPGTQIDVAKEMEAVAQQVVIHALFGADFQDRDGRLLESIVRRQQYLAHVFFSLNPIAQYVPPWTWWRYRQAMRHIHATIARELGLRREGMSHGSDLLSMLMGARYEDGAGMTDQRIQNEVMILLITGYESLADGMTWMFHVLSESPEVARKLVAEVDEALGGRCPSADDVWKLPYAGMVLAETLRLYPPSWIMVRHARSEDVLPSGVRVSEGAKIYLCQYVMHRHPLYYPDPERFDPSRFTDDAKKGRPQFAYFPFGGGARVCIGEHFAKLEAILVLAMAVQRFTFHPVAGRPVVLEPRMTLRPKDGLVLRVEVRR
jgi:cytochrome P450